MPAPNLLLAPAPFFVECPMTGRCPWLTLQELAQRHRYDIRLPISPPSIPKWNFAVRKFFRGKSPRHGGLLAWSENAVRRRLGDAFGQMQRDEMERAASNPLDHCAELPEQPPLSLSTRGVGRDGLVERDPRLELRPGKYSGSGSSVEIPACGWS